MCLFPSVGFHKRLGKAAKMPFAIHPHMLRYVCGFKLANDGPDTPSLQHYLGHTNIRGKHRACRFAQASALHREYHSYVVVAGLSSGRVGFALRSNWLRRGRNQQVASK
jgi:diadenosine tetraphosphatase ApaH/serine/threonine PP2A family protein phosphatase